LIDFPDLPTLPHLRTFFDRFSVLLHNASNSDSRNSSIVLPGSPVVLPDHGLDLSCTALYNRFQLCFQRCHVQSLLPGDSGIGQQQSFDRFKLIQDAGNRIIPVRHDSPLDNQSKKRTM
jgi:hypothetical protein